MTYHVARECIDCGGEADVAIRDEHETLLSWACMSHAEGRGWSHWRSLPDRRGKTLIVRWVRGTEFGRVAFSIPPGNVR